jgi:hypothetical protein
VEVMEVIKGALAPLLLKEERPRSWVETNRFFNHDGLDSLMSQSLRTLRYIGCGAKDYHFSDVQP